MKSILPKLVVVVLLFITSLLGWRFGRHSGFVEGYEEGYEKGAKDGSLVGEIRGCLNPIETILTGRAIAEKGFPEKGELFITRSLYYNAYFLDSNRNAPLLTKGEKEVYDSLVNKVGEYYWKHTATLNLDIKAPNWEPADSTSIEAVASAQKWNEAPVKMRDMLKRLKPTNGEQSVDGKPPTATQAPK